MGVGMSVFIEYRIPSKDLSTATPWELDLQSSGPVDERFGARGIAIPRGLDLYYMMGYSDDYRLVEDLSLSKPVENYHHYLADTGTFWTTRTMVEVKIIRRCFAISANIHPNDVDESDAWPVSIGKVYHRMMEIEKEGLEARLVIHIE